MGASPSYSDYEFVISRSDNTPLLTLNSAGLVMPTGMALMRGSFAMIDPSNNFNGASVSVSGPVSGSQIKIGSNVMINSSGAFVGNGGISTTGGASVGSLTCGSSSISSTGADFNSLTVGSGGISVGAGGVNSSGYINGSQIDVGGSVMINSSGAFVSSGGISTSGGATVGSLTCGSSSISSTGADFNSLTVGSGGISVGSGGIGSSGPANASQIEVGGTVIVSSSRVLSNVSIQVASFVCAGGITVDGGVACYGVNPNGNDGVTLNLRLGVTTEVVSGVTVVTGIFFKGADGLNYNNCIMNGGVFIGLS